MSTYTPRGFTLVIAVVLTSVLLSIGFTLLDITYKQIRLASAATQSTAAFYAADAALECALYADQKQGAFGYSENLSSITCQNQAIAITSSVGSGARTSVFLVPCVGGGNTASVTVIKQSDGTTAIYANGYNSCSSTDPRRTERGMKITY
jgi:Tfp pilus assembly protein PilX